MYEGKYLVGSKRSPFRALSIHMYTVLSIVANGGTICFKDKSETRVVVSAGWTDDSSSD